MTSSIKRGRKLHRRHQNVPNGHDDQVPNDLNFEEQWEELVIRFDNERGDYTVRTTSEARTADLHHSDGHRLG